MTEPLKENALTAGTVQGAQKTTLKPNHISNADFLRGLFPTLEAGEYGWACSFAIKPTPDAPWGGFAFTDFGAVKDYLHGNGYFSPALMKCLPDKPRKRRKENFIRLPLVVVDDFTGNTECTYRLQTSAGKCQVGWKLSDAITNVGIAERLFQALGLMDLIPADKSGNNLVRYVRLPVQINTKYQPHFAGVLEHYEPERIFTLKEVCELLGIDYLSIINAPSKATETSHNAPIVSADTRISDSELVANLCKGETMHESLNVYVARQVSRGFDAQAISATVHGFMAAHDDGTERYKARIGEIDRSLAGAIEKFSPSQDEAESVFEFYEYTAEKPKPIEFCIDGFIADGITVIAGSPGVGKTTILVALGATVAHLTKGGLEHPALRRPVIYVTEDKRQVERELYAMKQRGLINASHEDIKHWFRIVPAIRKAPEAIGNMVANIISEFSLNHESGYLVKPLTVLDTVSANIDLDNENDNAEVGKAIAYIKQANDGAPLWLTAHTAKAMKRDDVQNLSVRGAGAFEGDANAVAYIFKEQADDLRFMKLGKHRYEADYNEIEFKTQTFNEAVPCPWGGFQSIWYRCGLPQKSSKAKREEYAKAQQEAHRDERMADIQEAIIKRLQSVEGGSLLKTQLRERLGMRASDVNMAIADMVDIGILKEERKGRERIVSLPLLAGTNGNVSGENHEITN